MQPSIIEQLRSLNQKFYQSFGVSFAATRGRVQPGVQQVVADFASEASILDLGCGHGHLAAHLAANGHHGMYLGLDSSNPLLDIARSTCSHPAAHFQWADLHLPDWNKNIGSGYDVITAFAVLHHIAGAEPRLDIVRRVHALLKPGGRFIFSCWNFLASERLRNRVQPWASVGLKEEDIDLGDYLLDWRSGGHGFRYVHHYTEADLARLAGASNFRITATRYADGAEGNLGIYQEWRPSE